MLASSMLLVVTPDGDGGGIRTEQVLSWFVLLSLAFVCNMF